MRLDIQKYNSYVLTKKICEAIAKIYLTAEINI